MSRVKPLQVEEGKWIRMTREGESLQCCDCSLVHKIKFRIVDGHIEIQWFLDNRTTAALRRKRAK